MAEQTWRLVPVEMTPEMEQAMADSLGACVKAWAVWADVLAAAPTPPAPQAMPPVTLPEPTCWTLTEILDKRETTYRALLWFSNPVNCAWSALYTADQLRTAIADDRKLRGGA
jgi:hypothetical protein